MVELNTTSSLITNNDSLYSAQDLQNLQGINIIKQFGLVDDYVELLIKDSNNNVVNINYNYLKQSNSFKPKQILDNNLFSEVSIEPEKEIINKGLIGDYVVKYNFYRKKITNGPVNKLFINEISSDRKELRLISNDISLSDFQVQSQVLINEIRNNAYKKEYLANFGNDNTCLVVNFAYDNNSLLLKLYEPLPNNYQLKDKLWIVEQVADSIEIFVSNTEKEILPETLKLRAPNFDIEVNNQINNPSSYETISSLLTAQDTNFYSQISSLIQDKSLQINIDYNFYENYIHYSSAVERLKNFAYKIGLIEAYKNELTSLNNIPLGTLTPAVSGNIKILTEKINNVTQKFDGYERFLYFTSGSSVSGSNSFTWPKQNNTIPYELYSITSSQVLNYLGSDNEYSTLYGGQMLSASIYDRENKDNFYYTIPEYIRENPENRNYEIFLSMIGQHFDNIWTYSNSLTDIYKAYNKLDSGISKDLVSFALKSLGTNLYSNEASSNSIFKYLLGIDPNNEIPSPITGYYSVPESQSISLSNLIISSSGILFIPSSTNVVVTNTLTNLGTIISSGSITSSILNNTGTISPNVVTVSSSYDINLIKIDTVSKEDYQKEIYKRIYHNLPLLNKSKGTERGLRALISCYGIPDTVLRISKFGGADKISSSIEYSDNRFTYAFRPTGSINGVNIGHGNIISMWAQLNRSFSSGSQVPQAVEIRFKPDKLVNLITTYSQSIFEVNRVTGSNVSASTTGYLWGLELTKDPSIHNSLKEDYGYLKLKLADSIGNVLSSSNIELPFFNGNFYNVLINQTPSPNVFPQTGSANAVDVTFNLYVKTNTGLYTNTQQGDYIGIKGSSSLFIPSTSASYYESYNYITNPTTHSAVLCIGGNGTGTSILGNSTNNYFKGIIQELRYWGEPLSQSVFDFHCLNPNSYEGNTSGSSYEKLALRLPLGNDLKINYISGSYIESSHPASSPSYLHIPSFNYAPYSSSFIKGRIPSASFEPFTEFYYYNSPNYGVLENTNSKVRILSSSLPENVLHFTNKIEKRTEEITKDNQFMEIGFSPSNEINKDIINQLGFFNIDEYIGNPQEAVSGSYDTLDKLKEFYFKKYTTNYDINDYFRLINYFDNSLFKMIKDFTPARANLMTGIIIKPHLLERNKQPRLPLEFEQPEYSGSLHAEEVSGGNGLDLNSVQNYYSSSMMGNLGLINYDSGSNDVEFYNGEFGGSIVYSYIGSNNPFTNMKYIN